MSDQNHPIVVKRIRKVKGGHHGGAWKIAYADFVTAMMAFFLLMWLLGSTTKADLQGIAEYFSTPLRVALSGGVGSGDSTSIQPGGGKDLSRSTGQVNAPRGEKKNGRSPDHRNDRAGQAEEELERKERIELEKIRQRIKNMIESSPSLRQFEKQILLDITAEGLRIQIVDEKNRPMFDLSSAELRPYAKPLLQALGKELNQVEFSISLSGHTDAHLYANGDKGFGNWELSSNRANASRREMIAGGMSEGKVLRVVGHSSTIHLDRSDIYNPINRRISIVVLNKKSSKNLLDGAGLLQGGV